MAYHDFWQIYPKILNLSPNRQIENVETPCLASLFDPIRFETPGLASLFYPKQVLDAMLASLFDPIRFETPGMASLLVYYGLFFDTFVKNRVSEAGFHSSGFITIGC